MQFSFGGEYDISEDLNWLTNSGTGCWEQECSFAGVRVGETIWVHHLRRRACRLPSTLFWPAAIRQERVVRLWALPCTSNVSYGAGPATPKAGHLWRGWGRDKLGGKDRRV